jgi:hypothetical protein
MFTSWSFPSRPTTDRDVRGRPHKRAIGRAPDDFRAPGRSGGRKGSVLAVVPRRPKATKAAGRLRSTTAHCRYVSDVAIKRQLWHARKVKAFILDVVEDPAPRSPTRRVAYCDDCGRWGSEGWAHLCAPGGQGNWYHSLDELLERLVQDEAAASGASNVLVLGARKG